MGNAMLCVLDGEALQCCSALEGCMFQLPTVPVPDVGALPVLAASQKKKKGSFLKKLLQ